MKLFFICLIVFLLSACQSISSQDPATTEETARGTFDNENADINEEEGLNHLVNPEYKEVDGLTVVNHDDNIWLKLAEGFDFDVPENERVKEQRDYFLKHPNYLQQVSKRAEPFLWLIIEQIESNDLPLELALLPVIESTFDPYAYSAAGAAGLWQFMPVSGARFGLNQDWWYDGRRDVVAATGGALKYMQFLHNYLGNDWLYAFAAYNSGEGRVERAIRQNKKLGKPTDYWNLALPKETQKYVPKLLALVDILRNHQKYGVELPYISNEQALTYVDIGSQIDLSYAAELAQLSLAEIQLLNPAFNHWATSPKGPHKLLLPNVVVEQFVNKLSKIDKKKRIQWDRYIVKSGDSLSLIAQRKKTTTNVLKQVNDLDNSFLKISQPLLIPIASLSQQKSLSKQANNAKSKAVTRQKIIHNVVDGDTLWDISRRYKVTSINIAKWNQFPIQKTLQPGQQLTIWKQQALKEISRHVSYQVRSGDSLGVIAQKFNVKTSDLLRWNNIKKSQHIKVGQKIKVYVAALKNPS